jgi:hypothetical protein
MDACGAHPVQLMLVDKQDRWCSHWPTHSNRVAFSCLVDLLGDEKATSSTGSALLNTFQSIVYLNYDRLRRIVARTLNNKEQLIVDLDKLYNSAFYKQQTHTTSSNIRIGVSTADNIRVRDLQNMLHELQKYKKKTFLLPNARQEAAEKQAFIEGALTAIGLDPTKVTAEGKNSALSEYLPNLLHIVYSSNNS